MSEIWQLELEQDLFPGRLITEIGLFFLGSPYRAGTLEQKGPERLVVNFTAFDCTTFVETVLALALCARAGRMSGLEFRRNLKRIRYREGHIDGYASRLHYFTDWLRDNEKKNIVRDVSRQLDGAPVRKKINFMTGHRDRYDGLKNAAAFGRMQLLEKGLSRRAFYVIDPGKVTRKQTLILEGDLIAFAADEEGLDVAHVGFAVRKGRHLHLLHASCREGAVVISDKTIGAFLKANKKFNGILVARYS